MTDEPFGRQPQPVTVQITGDQRDVDHWQREFVRRVESRGDGAQLSRVGAGAATIKIFPRAVND